MQRKFILAIKRLCYLNLIMVWSGVKCCLDWYRNGLKISIFQSIPIMLDMRQFFKKPSFQDAAYKCKFGVIPVSEFYESKYIENKPQRWGVRRKDGKAFYIAALYEIRKLNDQIIRSAAMLTMDAIDHPMMKDFHEPGDVKRSVVVIPDTCLDDWLSLKQPYQLNQFMQGFPVEEFECSHVPKARIEKITPQLNMFD